MLARLAVAAEEGGVGSGGCGGSGTIYICSLMVCYANFDSLVN